MALPRKRLFRCARLEEMQKIADRYVAEGELLAKLI